ncbi:HD-GYP domain-containing protein [Paenibacillus cymbidii]|uniref:HD-GYP domain-containing protein n=1 Tax=Paenibacillus cymbidii TaxID=1639034 RepID=UPI001080EA5E|nr:HD domain-containing phosphohydrolase [Paenibacillus cymbidii]
MQVATYGELVGKRLLHSVVNANGMMLLPVDTILSESHVEKLERFKIDIFDIQVESPDRERSRARITDKARSAKSAETIELVKRTDATLHEIEAHLHAKGSLSLPEIEQSLLPAIVEATKNRSIYKFFSELKEEGDFRFKHSIGVAYIATMIGSWMKLDEAELSLLTTAASLCDIGSMKLPSELLHKTAGFEPDEYELVQKHPEIGYALLKDSELDPRISLVALQHHEREDGSGYPAQLTGDQIDPLSKIVAIADVYMAMTSDRPQRLSLPFYQVIDELYNEIVRNRFDSSIGMTFLNRLMSAQVGSDIILSDGRLGRIVLINANYPASPLVEAEGEFIDLSKTNRVKIAEILG